MKAMKLAVVCLLLMAKTVSASTDPSIDDIFNLMDNGEKNIQLDDAHKDTVLFIGNTGSGKSTLVQLIAGDNSKLIAKQTDDGEFIIEDHNRISDEGSGADSKTEFPELVIENVTDTAFYDCPGFSDTRGPANDIGSAYFIKKVTDFSDRVKFVLVVSYNSVTAAGSRTDFTDLLKHVTTLINDIDKFNSSLALVVTKVNSVFKHDNDVAKGVAKFLSKLLHSSALNNEADKEFGIKATKVVNILLDKDGDTCSRIGIFRTPNEEGPLDKSEFLKEGREHIKYIIHDNSQFVERKSHSFGYTISKDSKLALLNMVDEFNNHITTVFRKSAANITDFYNSLSYKKPSIVGEILKLGYDSFTEFVSDISSSTSGPDYIEKFEHCIDKTLISTRITELKEIQKKFIFVSFLGEVSGLQFKTRPFEWVDSFRTISAEINTIVQSMQNIIASELNNITLQHSLNIESYFNSIDKIIGEYKTVFLDKAINGFPALELLIKNSRTVSPYGFH